MRRFFLTLLLVSVLPLTGCSGKHLSPSTTRNSVSPRELEGKTWQAVSINGKAVDVFPDQDTPHLLFFEATDTTARVAGSDGCNRLIGSARFNGSALTFPPMGSTMMACPAGFEQSTAFKKALAETTTGRMVNGNLELLTADSPVVVLKPVVGE